jgi:hypothetical protein
MEGKDVGEIGGPSKGNGEAKPRMQKSSCVHVQNMFDSKLVDLNKDPSFYIEIKEQVYDVCQDLGSIDRVYVEQGS